MPLERVTPVTRRHQILQLAVAPDLVATYETAPVPCEAQPSAVRECLGLVMRGVSRVLACKLTGVDSEGWDLELTLALDWRRAEMEIRLWTRFGVGGDLKSLETWADCIAKDTGTTRTATMTLRDALIDDPIVLAYLAAQEAATLRGQVAAADTTTTQSVDLGQDPEGVPLA